MINWNGCRLLEFSAGRLHLGGWRVCVGGTDDFRED